MLPRLDSLRRYCSRPSELRPPRLVAHQVNFSRTEEVLFIFFGRIACCGYMCHVQRGLCVCLLGTLVSCSKVAEPVQILFTGKTRIGPRKLVFDGVQIFRLERGSLIWDMCWLIGKGSPRLICNAAIKIEVVFVVVFVQNAVHTRMMIMFS